MMDRVTRFSKPFHKADQIKLVVVFSVENVDGSQSIQNLSLIDVSISGKNNVGALVAGSAVNAPDRKLFH